MSQQTVNVIILIAGVQGLFLAILIFHRFRELYANRFLAGLMFIAALVLFNLYLGEVHPLYRVQALNLVLIGLSLLIGPLQFLYAKYLIHYIHRFQRHDWLHFLPIILYELTVLPFLFYSKVHVVQSLQSHVLHDLPLRYIFFNWALTLVCLFYLCLTLTHLRSYRRGLKKVVSSLEAMRLRWLQNLTYLSIGAWMIFFMQNLFFVLHIYFDTGFSISSVLSGFFVFLLGYWGLFKSDWLLRPSVAQSMGQLALEEAFDRTIPVGIKETPRYQKSGLTPEKAKLIMDGLQVLMEEKKPYLDSELTLAGLAEQLDISIHNLSEVLNTHLQLTFFDFINQYRIEQVKKDLMDQKKAQEKILTIALDAGFNSKTAFNMIFKKHTGKTPSEYRQIELIP